jgi:hypothetical protein
MEVLYVPWAWHWFSLIRCQADTSRSAHLGYPVGTFLAGGKFVHVPPAKHPPEDQFFHLELHASHELLVVAPERLPVACIFIAACHLRSSTKSISSHRSWSCMASSYVLTCREPMVTFGGRTTSAPYTMKKDVSPVARLGEVRLPHNAHESSSIHFFPCFFKPS